MGSLVSVCNALKIILGSRSFKYVSHVWELGSGTVCQIEPPFTHRYLDLAGQDDAKRQEKGAKNRYTV